MPKFIVEIYLDEEYANEAEEAKAAEDYIYEALSFAGSFVKVTPIEESSPTYRIDMDSRPY